MNDNKKGTGKLSSIFVSSAIFLISLSCLVGMFICIYSFVDNQRSFNKLYTEATSTVVEYIEESETDDSSNPDLLGQTDEPYSEKAYTDNVSTILSYLENLQIVQKNSVSNDLMSFIYGILSTILVGLCAGFVVKSKQNADDAQRLANKAKNDAKKSQKYTNFSKRLKKETKENVETVKQLSTEMFNQIQNYKSNIRVLSIHIEITHARYYLETPDQVSANARIYGIWQQTMSIDNTCDIQFVLQLRDELLVLKNSIDKFKEISGQVDSAKKISMLQSVERYIVQIDESIRHCDSIIHMN